MFDRGNPEIALARASQEELDVIGMDRAIEQMFEGMMIRAQLIGEPAVTIVREIRRRCILGTTALRRKRQMQRIG